MYGLLLKNDLQDLHSFEQHLQVQMLLVVAEAKYANAWLPNPAHLTHKSYFIR